MDNGGREHSPAREKAEAMFGRAQSARPVAETEEDAHRREAREKITRLKSLRTGNAATDNAAKDI